MSSPVAVKEKYKMKVNEIVAQIKKDQPTVLGKMPDRKAARIIRAAFGQVGREISAAKEGVVSAPGLGNFKIRQVERNKDGQKVAARHVVFRASKGKVKEKAKARQKPKPEAS